VLKNSEQHLRNFGPDSKPIQKLLNLGRDQCLGSSKCVSGGSTQIQILSLMIIRRYYRNFLQVDVVSMHLFL